MIARRHSLPIHVGDVVIGGDAPVVVQSMAKTDTRNIDATVDQICRLQSCGCEVVRVAVPDKEAAMAIARIKKGIRVPLIADIHFDYRLALIALDAGVDGLRLNPGNIRDTAHITAVVRSARERSIPIRIGVNSGSLPTAGNSDMSVVERMVEAALWEIKILENLDFNLIKISLKAFDIPTTVEAYKMIADRVPYALHLGITEAGMPPAGAIRSAIGIGMLLAEGIGDTIRVSLTADPEQEVAAAYEILKSLNMRDMGATLVSCPTCGRCEVDLFALAQAVEVELKKVHEVMKVAVMGCVVNGPGEARDADVGIACGKGRGAIFRRGEVIRTVEEKEFLAALLTEVETLSKMKGQEIELPGFSREYVLKLVRDHNGSDGLDLSGSNFDGVDLSGLDLHGVVLNEASLQDANLCGTDLHGAQMESANLRRSRLVGANLQDAVLDTADLREADLWGADVRNGFLKGADLRDAVLEDTDLREARLGDAVLDGAHLMNTNLRGSDLGGARLCRVWLCYPEISRETNLVRVDWGPDCILQEEEAGYTEEAAHSYSIIKQWYDECGLHEVADKFLLRESRARERIGQ